MDFKNKTFNLNLLSSCPGKIVEVVRVTNDMCLWTLDLALDVKSGLHHNQTSYSNFYWSENVPYKIYLH